MHVLTEEEFQRDAEPVFNQIFVGNNDTEPFKPQVEERLLLYFHVAGNPERNYCWQRQLFESIAHAASKIGDTGCYLASAWEGNAIITTGGFRLNRFAYISQSELVEAFAAPYCNSRVWSLLKMSDLYFCLFSESGKWGLLTTIDDHAFLGGSSKFIQAVKSYFPEIEQEACEYLKECKIEQMYEEIDVQWLQQVLTHVYDSTIAENLLKEAELL
jgi:hypothetical protein